MPQEIDRTVLQARKAYHRVDDAPRRLLDTELLQQDRVFEEVQILDFYRYTDVELDQMLAYLAGRVPWVRPKDTGRSTNCLINDVGIYVHQRRTGYHNYALPYSWDVRLGHKQRDAALAELDDDIDGDRVQAILDQIGYTAPITAPDELRLVAYYEASSEVPDDGAAGASAATPAGLSRAIALRPPRRHPTDPQRQGGSRGLAGTRCRTAARPRGRSRLPAHPSSRRWPGSGPRRCGSTASASTTISSSSAAIRSSPSRSWRARTRPASGCRPATSSRR